MGKQKVRICVARDPGESVWNAVGWFGGEDCDVMNEAIKMNVEGGFTADQIVWVDAEIADPEVVQGTVAMTGEERDGE